VKEIDSFVACAMINGTGNAKLQALIVSATPQITSMNGVVVQAQAPLSFAREADAVLIGSSRASRDVVRTPAIMDELRLDPSRQIIGSPCSGTLVLAKLGLLANVPAGTDLKTQGGVEEAGGEVLRQPFVPHCNGATP